MWLSDITKTGRKIVLFGAVENNINKYIIKNNIAIDCFIDNDFNKQGKYIFQKEIKAVDFLITSIPEKPTIIISTYGYWDEMKAQLERMGLDDYYVAIEDFEDFSSIHFQAFCNNIDIDFPKIDTLHIELSSYCNCKCIYCPFHGVQNIKKHRGFMSWETLKKCVEQAKSINTISTLDVVGNGELFLNNEWYEMITYALKKLNISKLVMYSNGMLFDKKTASKITLFDVDEIRIEISIDGTSPTENNLYRKGSIYSTVKKNILEANSLFLSDNRIKLNITNCYPISVEKIKQNGGDNTFILDDLVVPDFLINDFPNIVSVSKSTLGLADSDIPGLKPIKVTWPNNSPLCLDIFHNLAIDTFGKMIRCSCWNAAIVDIGDVYKDNLVDIWYNDEQIKLSRNHFLTRNPDADFCLGCPRRGMGDYYILLKNNI